MRRQYAERGAIAVVFAICATLIFSVAAMGVDLGNAFNRKRQAQSQADLAALAGAASLPATSATPTAADPAVQAVANYLIANHVVSDDGTTLPKASVLANHLVDPSKKASDGQVYYGSFDAKGNLTPDVDTLTVVAPTEQVNFGLANAMGFHDTKVNAVATAHISSPSPGMAPFYATTSCDTGIQTLKDNSNGLSLPISVPPLYADADSNVATLTSISPTQVAFQASGSTISLTGSNLGSVTAVGFFNSDQTAPQAGSIVGTPTSTSVTATIPTSVTAVQDIWYVRVQIAGKWSARTGAQPLEVGAALLSCDPESSSGNFGSLDLPGWNGSTDDQVATNIATGLAPGLTLAPYPPTIPSGTCPTSDSRTVISSKNDLHEGTNCVSSEPGLRAGAATMGFITGVNGYPGRLDVDTSKACQDLGQPERDLAIGSDGVNDDLLTCFFKDPTTRISDATNPSYSGGPLFTADIYASPRLLLVPVFLSDPNGKKIMPIDSFAYGFITDQPSGATRQNELIGTETDNGLVMKNSSLRAIRIIFINPNTLPVPKHVTKLIQYIGVGPKVVTLTN